MLSLWWAVLSRTTEDMPLTTRWLLLTPTDTYWPLATWLVWKVFTHVRDIHHLASRSKIKLLFLIFLFSPHFHPKNISAKMHFRTISKSTYLHNSDYSDDVVIYFIIKYFIILVYNYWGINVFKKVMLKLVRWFDIVCLAVQLRRSIINIYLLYYKLIKITVFANWMQTVSMPCWNKVTWHFHLLIETVPTANTQRSPCV